MKKRTKKTIRHYEAWVKNPETGELDFYRGWDTLYPDYFHRKRVRRMAGK